MALLDSLQFYFMHFMPYAKLPVGRTQGQWVDIPNTHFDPVEGNKLYKQYLDELVLGDQLGYDGLVVNEHHSTFYSLMPSCSVIGGALDVRPIELPRGFGMAWGVGGWLLFPFLMKIGQADGARLRQRVVDELKTTFASHYTKVVSLAEALDPANIAVYAKRATGEKYLINPNKGG